MEHFFVLILVGFTSLGAVFVGLVAVGLPREGLRRAIGKMLDGVGWTLVFFLVNIAAGMTVVLVGRLLTSGFLSLYLTGDVTLLVLSLFQGLTIQWWRERRGSIREGGVGGRGLGIGTDMKDEWRERRSA